MMSKIFLIALCFIASVSAFTVQPTVFAPTTTSHKCRQVRFMSNDANAEAERLREKARQLKEEVAALSGTTVEEMEAAAPVQEKQVANPSGDLYDDEIAEYKDPISDNMRAKLMREASTGLDSNQKQTNVILYISVVVAILVALGGKGILY
jgi:TolA-binding protein